MVCFPRFWNSLTKVPCHLCEGKVHPEIQCASCANLLVNPIGTVYHLCLKSSVVEGGLVEDDC